MQELTIEQLDDVNGGLAWSDVVEWWHHYNATVTCSNYSATSDYKQCMTRQGYPNG